MGWEDRGVQGSHEVAGKGYVFTKNSQITSIGAIFTSTHTCYTKQPNPWTNSLGSHVVILSWLPACQGNLGPFEGHPSTRRCQTGLRKRLELKQTVQPSAILNTCAFCPLV